PLKGGGGDVTFVARDILTNSHPPCPPSKGEKYGAFAHVVLPLTLDQPFTYSVPNPLRHRIAVGMRVVVPFQKRIETGTVVGLADNSDVEGVRPLIDLPDDGPIFSQELLDLSRWMAEYYC